MINMVNSFWFTRLRRTYLWLALVVLAISFEPQFRERSTGSTFAGLAAYIACGSDSYKFPVLSRKGLLAGPVEKTASIFAPSKTLVTISSPLKLEKRPESSHFGWNQRAIL